MAHLSTGDMLRAARDAKTDVGVKADKFMSSGALVPDDIIVAIIAERLEQPDCQQGYLLDGFPRTIAQAEALDAMLAEKGTPLDVGPGTAGARGGVVPPAGRPRPGRRHARGDPPAAGGLSQADRAACWNTTAARGLLKSIDGLGTVDEIFDRSEGGVGRD